MPRANLYKENQYYSQSLDELIHSLKQNDNRFNHAAKWEILTKTFGKDQIKKIGRRSWLGVDFSKKQATKSHISDKELRKLFVGVADVLMEDVTQLLDEMRLLIQKASHIPTLRHLGENKSKDVCELFFDSLKEINEPIVDLDQLQPPLTKEQFDVLMFILVPFRTLNDIFLGSPPKIPDRTVNCGYGYTGHSVIAYLTNELRLREDLGYDTKEAVAEKAVIYGKRLVDRELKPGTIVPDPGAGYYCAKDAIYGPENSSGRFYEGGAYITPLKAITIKSAKFRSLLLCRGTRPPPSTAAHHAWFDNLRKNQGSNGVIQVHKRVKSLLSDQYHGFIEDPHEKIFVAGMSLGGGHAARLTVLFSDRVSKVVLVSPIGIDKYTLDYFAQKSEFFPEKMQIDRIFDEGDLVLFYGDGHLGLGCRPQNVEVNLYKITSPDAIVKKMDAHQNNDSDQSGIRTFYELLKAQYRFHTKNQFEDECQVIHMSNQSEYEKVEDLQDNQKCAPQFEKWRQKFALLGKERDFVRFCIEHDNSL